MSDSELIDVLGGTGALAQLFGIAPASVSEWRKNGIPKARRQTLAVLYPKKVPEDWHPVVGVETEPESAPQPRVVGA